MRNMAARYNLGQLAENLRARLVGDPALVIDRVQPFESAVEGDLTWAGKSFISHIRESRASAFIIADGSPLDSLEGRNLLIAKNPKLAFARAIKLFYQEPYRARGISQDLIIGEMSEIGPEPSIFPRVTIGRDCRIGSRVTLHPGVVIGDRVRIGDDTIIYANVSIYSDVEIGSRVIIHSGAVIGADGFGFVLDEEGRQQKILQTGGVMIEDDVEIGANCSIDRATFGKTILKRGVKLDNLVQVAHNCVIGEETVIVAQVGLSGSTTVGHHVVIAGQAATNQHVSIGDRAVVGGQAGVTKDVPAGTFVAGTPAQLSQRWKRAQVLFSRLPEIVERLKKLEEMVKGAPDK